MKYYKVVNHPKNTLKWGKWSSLIRSLRQNKTKSDTVLFFKKKSWDIAIFLALFKMVLLYQFHNLTQELSRKKLNLTMLIFVSLKVNLKVSKCPELLAYNMASAFLLQFGSSH